MHKIKVFTLGVLLGISLMLAVTYHYTPTKMMVQVAKSSYYVGCRTNNSVSVCNMLTRNYVDNLIRFIGGIND